MKPQKKDAKKARLKDLPAGKKAKGVKGGFEVEDYSFDVEQVLNIGSASSGAGASKVKPK